MNQTLQHMKKSVLKSHASMNDQELIKKYTPSDVEKGDEYAGHHAIVTAQDMIVQAVIIEELQKEFPNAKFIAEEELPDTNLMQNVLKENFQENVQGEVFGIDSIDGTAQFNSKKHEWSISLGYSNNMKHKLGVIYAPKLTDGLFFGGEEGVFITEGEKTTECKSLSIKEDKELMVEIGADTPTESKFNKFVNNLANKARCLTVNGSCALGLAYVAAGKSDLLIQPPQRVWDWYAGIALVEGVGGKVQFYRINKDKITPIELQQNDYNPGKKELGFVAGHPDLVDKTFKQLQESYGN